MKVLYKHSKTGNIYELLSIAEHEKTHEILAVYTQYPDSGIIWVRPYNEFNDIVIVDNIEVQRFVEIKE